MVWCLVNYHREILPFLHIHNTYTVKLFVPQYFGCRFSDMLNTVLSPIMFMRILTAVIVFGFDGFYITVSYVYRRPFNCR
jgi:hypothetical protein